MLTLFLFSCILYLLNKQLELEMKALQDKQELRARNKAYKTTLQYCPETCDDVDILFSDAITNIFSI